MGSTCCCCGEEYNEILKDVFRCSACRHIFRDYVGDSIEYHVNLYRESAGLRENGEIVDNEVTHRFHENRTRICKDRIQLIKDYVGAGDTCLDVGAGAGTFVNFLRESVKSIECTELDTRLIRECKRFGFKVYEEDFLEIKFDKKYDVVFLWHVLEHIKDVNKVMKKIYQICDKCVFLEVPLLVAMDKTGRRRDLKPPNDAYYDGHYHYFNSQSFEKLAKKHNFKIKEIKEGVQTPACFAVLEKCL